jgi:hypothetical protein
MVLRGRGSLVMLGESASARSSTGIRLLMSVCHEKGKWGSQEVYRNVR